MSAWWELSNKKLSYCKQIERQLRTQYIEGIYTNSVTLKSRLRVTENRWKWQHSIDNTWHTISVVSGVIYFDIEYYCDLTGYSRSLKIVQFESVDTVSYSHSVATMAVSLAILETFSIIEWPDLEIWVWGHSRSLIMVRFDRPYTTFYWSAIVRIDLCCTSFEDIWCWIILMLKTSIAVYLQL